ncbi:MAG: hypothetical protein WCI73_15015 [Phycisphaerae bacterium]
MITAIVILSAAIFLWFLWSAMIVSIVRMEKENQGMHLTRLEQHLGELATAMRLYMVLPNEPKSQQQVLKVLEIIEEDLACAHSLERSQERLMRSFQNCDEEVRRVSIPVANESNGRITPAHLASKRRKA